MAYARLEEPLKLIHKKFVALDRAEMSAAEAFVHQVVNKLTNYMQVEDALFKELFVEPYFGGSFYHDLKIERPDEFDIDFTLRLPSCKACKDERSCECLRIAPGPSPGFLAFHMEERFFPAFYRRFCKWGGVQTNLVYNWSKSLICRAVRKFNENRSSFGDGSVAVKLYTECAPALKLCISHGSESTFIDLAFAFKLDERHWPSAAAGYKPNLTQKKYFSIVPQSPKGDTCFNALWRLSFQEQEKELISGKERLKPALRLLKIMRNNLGQHKVSSYILKTLLLEAAAEPRDWKSMSLADTFMTLLEKYLKALERGCLKYYWHPAINLLEEVKFETLRNHYNQVAKLFLQLQREYSNNHLVVAKIILKKPSDYDEFVQKWNRLQSAMINGQFVAKFIKYNV